MSPEELGRAWVQAWTDGDFEASNNLVADDAWLGITAPSAGTSKAQSDQDARAWKAAFPDGRGTVKNVVASGNTAALEVEWTGTNTGSMMGMPPTGKSVRVQAAVFVTAENGKIAHFMHYLDVAGILGQLGMLPAPGQ